MATAEKQAIVDALLARLDEEIANMTMAAKTAADAATHEEAKPENDKDTRALEASYLAAGQAARVRELETAVKMIRTLPLRALEGDAPVQASAVVVVEDEDGTAATYFMAPHGGGTTCAVGTVAVQIITPQSALGQALLGKTKGEVAELRVKGGVRRELSIVDVR